MVEKVRALRKYRVLAKELSSQKAPMYNCNAVRLYFGISRNSYLFILPPASHIGCV